MKRFFVLLLLLVIGFGALAQHISAKTEKKKEVKSAVPPPTKYTVTFESQHGEAFMVYIDGDIQNRLPQSRVMVNDVSGSIHEVIVVMKRPVDKAASLRLRPGRPNVKVNINYDERLERLYLYTPEHNRPQEDDDKLHRYINRRSDIMNEIIPLLPSRPANDDTVAEINIPAEDEVAAMADRMKAVSFNSDRLALGKVLVSSANLKASQIATLAQTIDFSNSQVEFLKYAYTYCIDPVNYHQAVEVLTYSSDKKKVLNYIATQGN